MAAKARTNDEIIIKGHSHAQPVYEDLGDEIQDGETAVVMEDEAGKMVVREFYDYMEMHHLELNGLAKLVYVVRKDGFRRRMVMEVLGALFEEMDFDPRIGKHSIFKRCSEERAEWIRKNCKPYRKHNR